MSEVFSPVVFENGEGELLSISERDDGFEIISSKKGAQSDPKQRRFYFVTSKGILDLGPNGKTPPPKGEKE